MTDYHSNTDSATWTGRIWKDGRFQQGAVSIEDGRIREARSKDIREKAFILPPFFDPHIHGGWGFDFQKSEFVDLEAQLRELGVGGAVPTLMNDTLHNLEAVSRNFAEYKEKRPDSIFPFLRVEGPFISHEKKGIQPKSAIHKPGRLLREQLLSIENIRVFTFAPEIEGADILVEEALAAGKIPSIGHSNASYRDARPFLEKGVRHMTHFPNAMRGLHHRDIGLLGTGLLEDNLDLEMIADGIHTSPEFIRLVHRVKGPRFSIASDMIPPACSPDGASGWSGLRLVNGALVDRNGTIAGGRSPVPEQAGFLLRLGISMEDVVRIACLNGRRFFGLPIPEIRDGEEASFMVCGPDLALRAFFLKGERIR